MRSISPESRRAGGKGKQRAALLRLALVAALAAGLAGCAGTGVRHTSHSFSTVVVDAGHGGHDPGTHASRLILEKDAALDVARQLETRLRASGFHTVMTRQGDYFVTLDDRVAISNRQRDAIFVSVHFNESRPNPGMHGVETYYTSSASSELASRILRHVGSVPGESANRIHTARFHVLRLNLNPAVLVECAYLSNRGDAARAASSEFRGQVAQAIADAVAEQRGRRSGSVRD